MIYLLIIFYISLNTVAHQLFLTISSVKWILIISCQYLGLRAKIKLDYHFTLSTIITFFCYLIILQRYFKVNGRKYFLQKNNSTIFTSNVIWQVVENQ